MDGLEGLHQLRELVLDKNRIKALADNSFISQNALLELRLSENRIQDFSHLGYLTELRKLFLDANKVQVAIKKMLVSNNRVLLICTTVYFWRSWFSAGFDLPAHFADCCICRAMSHTGVEYTLFSLPLWYFSLHLQSKT